MERSIKDEFKRTWLTSLIGIALGLGGMWILVWNEKNAVYHTNSLGEAMLDVISLNVYEPIRSEYNDRLVYLSGPLLIDEPLTDSEYAISIQAVKLKRRVQMFQWVEQNTPLDFDADERDPERSNTDYHYITEWRDKLVNSNSFYIRYGHHNPTKIPLKSHVYVSPSVRVGQLYLGEEMKVKFDDYVEMTSDERPEQEGIKLHLGIYYHCDDVWNPEVGDIRVQFYHAGHNGDFVSMVAMQKDGVLVPYYTVHSNRKVLMLRYGQYSLEQMFNAEKNDVMESAWKTRFAGFCALFFSNICLSKLIHLMCRKNQFLKRVVPIEPDRGTSLSITIFAASLVLAISWFAHRPFMGLTFFAISLSPFYYGLRTLVSYFLFK